VTKYWQFIVRAAAGAERGPAGRARRASLFAHSKEKDVDMPALINTVLDIKP
jgi:hypothetical protein